MNKHHDTITMDINVIIVVYSSNETIEDMIPHTHVVGESQPVHYHWKVWGKYVFFFFLS